jgi:hypothetical protein
MYIFLPHDIFLNRSLVLLDPRSKAVGCPSWRCFALIHNAYDRLYQLPDRYVPWCAAPTELLTHVCSRLLLLQDSSPHLHTYPLMPSQFPHCRHLHPRSRSMSSLASSGSRIGPMQVTLLLVPCPRCSDEVVTAICRHGTRLGVRFYKCCHCSVRFVFTFTIFFVHDMSHFIWIVIPRSAHIPGRYRWRKYALEENNIRLICIFHIVHNKISTMLELCQSETLIYV